MGQYFIDISLIIHKNSHYILYSSGKSTARPEARARALGGRPLHSPPDFTQHSYEASWFIKMDLRINTRKKKRQCFQAWREADENTQDLRRSICWSPRQSSRLVAASAARFDSLQTLGLRLFQPIQPWMKWKDRKAQGELSFVVNQVSDMWQVGCRGRGTVRLQILW